MNPSGIPLWCFVIIAVGQNRENEEDAGEENC